MKIGLLAVLAAALVLAGSVYYWKTRAEVESGATRSTEAPAPKAAPPAEVRLEAAPLEASASAPAVPESRTSAATAPTPERVSASAEPAVVDFGSDSSAASIADARAGEYTEFAKKYQTTSAPNRKLARETIEAILFAHKRGTEDKGQAITEEQFASLSHEAEWLGANPAP